MEEIKRIDDQLKRAFEGEAWHGPSLQEILNGVNARQAAAKPLAGAHSIWEIVLHIAAWEGAVRRRLEGQAVELSSAEDWPAVRVTEEAAWQAALTSWKHGHRKLRETMARLTDNQLKDTATGCDYSNYFMLHGVIQHDLYHAGQIAILKKERI